MNRRRGWGLMQMLGAMFAGSLVLGATIPLYLAGQREADLGTARAHMNLEARELAAAFRQDVRAASRVEVLIDGRELRLLLPRPEGPADSVTYRPTPGGLRRELKPAAGAGGELREYGAPLTSWSFARRGGTVIAELKFHRRLSGRSLDYHLACSATPRSAL